MTDHMEKYWKSMREERDDGKWLITDEGDRKVDFNHEVDYP